MKKRIMMILTCLLLIGMIPCESKAAKKILTVKCDGQLISSDRLYAVEKNDGTVVIPCRMLSHAPTAKVQTTWDYGKKHFTIERNNIVLEMYGGKKELVKNNEFKYTVPSALCYYEMQGRKYLCIPAEKICTLLGFRYTYDKTSRTLSLRSRKPITNFNASMTTRPFLLMSTEEFVEAIAPLAQKEYRKSGMLASVTIAQAINESWSGVSYLAQKGNNLFGMKCYLSGNTWKGTTWKGKKVVKKTKEQYGKRVVTITDSFRKYDNVGQSFADHTAYFLNAKNEYGVKRYKGLTDTKSYKKQIAIIMKGGYCTFDVYGQTLIDLIKEYDLTRFDK